MSATQTRPPVVPANPSTPSRGFAERVRDAFGGPPGQHATGVGNWVNMPVLLALLATLTWLVTTIRQQACLPGGGDGFANFCYSDLSPIYTALGGAGNQVYFDSAIDQPVLTGYLIEVIRFVMGAFGAETGAVTDADASTFIGFATVVLFGCFLVAVFATARIQRRWREGVMLAVSPAVVMTGLINFDLFAVALTMVALALWSRRNPVAAGAFLGLAMAARIYPAVLLIALLIVCIRGRRVPEWLNLLGAFLLTWALVNLPVMLLAPAAWTESWTANTSLGSIWYVLGQAGTEVPEVGDLSTVLFILACIGIAAVAFLAERRPRVAQVSYLVVWAMFVTNADYRPQYALLLAALMVIARPNWRDWAIFSFGEVFYVFAVWAYLGGSLDSSAGDGAPAYDLAVVLRMATQTWVAAMVVVDIWRPARDPARTRGGEDPGAGVLRGAADAEWVARWRAYLIPWPVLWGRFWRGEAEPGTPALAPLAPPMKEGPGGFREIVGVWLIGRASIVLTGAMVMMVLGLSFFEIIWRWDTERFMTIAQYWYPSIDTTYRAFYPGWPMVLQLNPVQLFGLSSDPETIRLSIAVWGVLIATACSLVAAAALVKLGGRWAAFGWIFAPMAVFTMMPYSESLFCAFAFWAWQRARADRWWQAALLAGLASTVRVSGLFLIGALVVMILVWAGIDWRGRLRRLAWLVVSVALLGAYTVYLYLLTGNWSAWSQAQEEGWARSFTMPWTSVENTLKVLDPNGSYVDQPFIMLIFVLEAVAWFLGFVVVGWCVRKKLWAEAAYVAVQLLAFSTSYWLQSVNRAILIWFPLWVMLAHLLLVEPKTTLGARAQTVFRVGWMVISPLMMVLWAWLYFTGEWAS
ncbi:glycosyltransferase family 87 protein [Naumannella halotolerans]|uniref:Uncharacterized protein DUF2029 n=1 Tax=Naumannella halotolerans TaxID=993414 RepID=A0A4R7J2C1_9ACTN|nr:glycosyltransferase 87 family protein [Naumannella halotolerans]TDT31155.1 uncharacterized protein DUF2029 [Naumannella halotolerans]